jgi:hypothetical protein
MGDRFARSERAGVVPEGTALPSVMTALLEKRRASEAIFGHAQRMARLAANFCIEGKHPNG